MPRTMQAYRLIEWQRPPELVEVPVPVAGPGQVVVRVAANGLCHSDVTMAQIPADIGPALGWSMPFTLGHEVGGWIAELGPGVAGLDAGEAVALLSPHSCGSCRQCLRRRESACLNGLAGRGYGRDGGLAEFVVADAERDVIPLRSLDPVVAGPLTDAGATSHHAVHHVVPYLTPSSTAVVVGAGGLGAFAIQILRALTPARVIAVDANPSRRQIALDLGAHHALDGVHDGSATEVRDASDGEGATAVLDFVGNDASIAMGLAATETGGAYGLVGAGGGRFKPPWFGGLPRDVDIFTFQGSDIADARAVIALAEDGRIRSEVDRFPLEHVADAYAAMEAGTLRGRAVVVPGR